MIPELHHYPEAETLSWGVTDGDRASHIRARGWFVLSKQVLKVLVDLLGDDNVLEVFSGTGYLAHQLKIYRPANTVTRAYDNRSYGRCIDDTWKAYKSPYAGSNKNAFMAPIKKADTVIMTWPMYQQNHAYRIARKMVVGQRLFYQGELDGGCCANDEFFNYLDTHFSKLPMQTFKMNHKHVNFAFIADQWAVYEKIK